jgi:L-aspartate oxidase
LVWRKCGIVRNGAELSEAIDELDSISFHVNNAPRRADFELRNMHTVATLIAKCALARRESRGGHYRSDFPVSLREFQKHSVVGLGHEISFQ